MRRKLICIFFILVGVAIFVGTIILSQERTKYNDTSPVWTLIILSIAMIAAALWYFRETYKPEISQRQRVFLWAFRIVNILAILVCLAFVIMMFFMTDYYSDLMLNVSLLMILAAVGITSAAFSLKKYPPNIWMDIIRTAIALIVAVTLCFISLNYMPKYSQEQGINMLRSDEGFAQKDVFYPSLCSPGEPNGRTYRHLYDQSYEQFGGNPFFDELFYYSCDSYGYDADGLHIMIGFIDYNPATGEYEYMRKQERDKTYSRGDYPQFNWNFIYDDNQQHNAVINLYLREWWVADTAPNMNRTFFASSGSAWDAKLKEVMYPHNFPESEARAFLRSFGEEALKTKLLEQINNITMLRPDNTGRLTTIGPKEKTIEVYFFGINIATYQNGEIVLKR